MKRHAITLVMVALNAHCGSEPLPAGGAGTSQDGPTYHQDIAPIIHRNCLGCHVSGGIGIHALDTPDTVRALAGPIAAATRDGIMPPWPPGALTPSLEHERKLSDADIALLQAFADAGAPLGDPTRAAALVDPEVLELGSVDAECDIGADYVPDASATDDFRCFVADPGIATPRMILGYHVRPGNTRTVHHVILELVNGADRAVLDALDADAPGPGWPCVAQDDARSVGSIGSWTPGVGAVLYPEGTGRLYPANALVVMRIHYNLAGGVDPDRTRLELELAPNGVAELTPLSGVGLRKFDLDIPAGERVVETITKPTDEWRQVGQPLINGDAYVLGVNAHAHMLAVRMSLSMNDGSGERFLLDIPRWDFNWQGAYFYVDPIRIDADDLLTLSCHYDNTLEHRAEVGLGPPVNVTWGEGTADEMCMGSLVVVDELPE